MASQGDFQAAQWPTTQLIDESLAEKQTYLVFEQYDQFRETQAALLSVDLFEEPSTEREREEWRMLRYLEGIVSFVMLRR